MKGFRLLLVLLAAVVVMVPRVSKAETSDFKATVSITESIQTPGTAPCFSVGTISGAGLASQAGKITIASVDCINPMDPTFTVFSFASDQLVMTAANGDKIFATYGGTFTLQGQFGIISGGYIIIGGTGRFAQATGAGSVNGQEDLTTGVGKGQVQLLGTISF